MYCFVFIVVIFFVMVIIVQVCGGLFNCFVIGFKVEVVEMGYSNVLLDDFFVGVEQD